MAKLQAISTPKNMIFLICITYNKMATLSESLIFSLYPIFSCDINPLKTVLLFSPSTQANASNGNNTDLHQNDQE